MATHSQCRGLGLQALAELRAAAAAGDPYHIALIDHHRPAMDGIGLPAPSKPILCCEAALFR
jgi:hypothetical protein